MYVQEGISSYPANINPDGDQFWYLFNFDYNEVKNGLVWKKIILYE